LFQQISVLIQWFNASVNKVNAMIVVEKWQNHYSLQWHDVNE